MVLPRIQPPVRQCEYIPFLQKSHLPQEVMQEISTLSPLRTPETPEPTSSTTPQPSWPRMRPSVTAGTSPFRMCRSVPQMVEVVTRTIASLASWILGLGLSSHAFLPGPWYVRAFIVPTSFAGVVAMPSSSNILKLPGRTARNPR